MSDDASGRQSCSAKTNYEHPKVLAVDLAKTAALALCEGGYNVRAGTFGAPIAVQRSRNPHPVPFTASLPNASEQEVVIVDLARPPLSNEPLSPGLAANANIWQPTRAAQVEPRLAMMRAYRQDFDRIYEHGGVFVIFAEPPVSLPFIYAPDGDPGYGREENYTSWGFLSALDGLYVTLDEGEEIRPEPEIDPPLAMALAEGASFSCLVEPYTATESRWLALGKSKYGKSVAGILVPPPDSAAGMVIVLPRIKDKGAVLGDLLENLLPRIAPKLFPEDERRAWAEEDLYAAPAVAGLRAEIAAVRGEADTRVAEIESQIETLRAEGAHLRGLLTATGTELVAAVKTTLESLGFADVRDVDAVEGVQEGRLREDLQIHLDSPIVLSEVKGINGLPRDEDALEVVKYILPRVREWDRTDVRGLTVVNHQRGLPPLARDANVFQGDQIVNAEGQDVGLISTWDLYRLARGFERNGWRPEDLRPLLGEGKGRIEPVPLHYARVGRVHNYLSDKGVAIVELSEGREVAVGQRLSFVGAIEFAEEGITSIQFEDKQLEVSPDSGRIGLKTGLRKEEVRKGTTVYIVGEANAPTDSSS